MPLFYLDSSAIVKLVADEPESGALRAFVVGADLLSCELVLTEVPRAIRRGLAQESRATLEGALERAGDVLGSVGLLPLDRAVLGVAGALDEPALRALDAIHVAAAADLAPIDAFVTYDERQAAVARLAAMRTMAPGA